MSSDTGNEYQLQVSEIFKEAIVVITIRNLKTDRHTMAKRKGAS